MLRSLVSLFRSRKAAENAQRDLQAAGVGNDAVTVVDTDHNQLDRVFAGAGMQAADAQLYRDGLRRGEAVVIVVVEEVYIAQVGDILDRHEPVDVARRRQELVDNGVITVPIIEEELRVGKRVVERGGVRVFIHVETIPVEVPVTLRDETVRVEHRPVNQPLPNPDALLREQVVEVHEIDEEPVVEKQAVVREEVVIRKEVEERTETVRDVVRRTAVEVEEVPSQESGTTTPASGRSVGDHGDTTAAGGTS